METKSFQIVKKLLRVLLLFATMGAIINVCNLFFFGSFKRIFPGTFSSLLFDFAFNRIFAGSLSSIIPLSEAFLHEKSWFYQVFSVVIFLSFVFCAIAFGFSKGITIPSILLVFYGVDVFVSTADLLSEWFEHNYIGYLTWYLSMFWYIGVFLLLLQYVVMLRRMKYPNFSKPINIGTFFSNPLTQCIVGFVPFWSWILIPSITIKKLLDQEARICKWIIFILLIIASDILFFVVLNYVLLLELEIPCYVSYRICAVAGVMGLMNLCFVFLQRCGHKKV